MQPGQREPTGRRELPGLSEHQSGEPPNTVLTREVVVSPSLGGVAQLVERLTGSAVTPLMTTARKCRFRC